MLSSNVDEMHKYHEYLQIILWLKNYKMFNFYSKALKMYNKVSYK